MRTMTDPELFELERATETLRYARRERDRLIVAARAAGTSLSRIAAAARTSNAQVLRVLQHADVPGEL